MKLLLIILAGLVALASANPAAKHKHGHKHHVSVTPHDQYSSAIGVLGCKIDVNRVAYFPTWPSCDKMCVKVSAKGRHVHLLHVDHSGGAHDISYDAWNYLNIGKGAQHHPTMGGGIGATYKHVPMHECAHLIKSHGGHSSGVSLPFSAANGIDFVTSCPAGSWVKKNHKFINIYDTQCQYGVDKVCHLHMDVSNQPHCKDSVLGIQTPLHSDRVYNIQYGTGKRVLAT